MSYESNLKLEHIISGQTIIIANQEQIKRNMRRHMYDTFYKWEERQIEPTKEARNIDPEYWAYMDGIEESKV